MSTVHIDPTFDDATRRQRIFQGDVIIYTRVPEIEAFAEFTRNLITEVFAPHEPTTVHESRTPEELADILVSSSRSSSTTRSRSSTSSASPRRSARPRR